MPATAARSAALAGRTRTCSACIGNRPPPARTLRARIHNSKYNGYYSEMIDLGELGARIQALRRDRGLTLQELAEAAPVSASMLSSVERGQKAPTIVVLAR